MAGKTAGGGLLDGAGWAPGQNPLDLAKQKLGTAYNWWVQNVINQGGNPAVAAAAAVQAQPPAPAQPALAPTPAPAAPVARPALAQQPRPAPALAPAALAGPAPALADPTAMSPEERAGILSQFQDGPNGPQPTPPASQQQAPQGFFGKLDARKDSGAIYDGLIAAGAGMLQGKNFQQGLGAALEGFNGAYDAKQAQTKAQGVPKVIPLADGAFSMMVFPNGTQKVVKNDEVASYLGDLQTDKTAAALQKMGYGAQLTQANQQAQVDNKAAVEARQNLTQTQSTIDQMEQALGVVSKQGTAAKVQGLPGISTVAGFLGTDEAANNKLLQGIKVDAALLETARTKGAISDSEMKLFNSPLPSLSDDRQKVWKPWLEQRIAVLRKAMTALQGTVARGDAPSNIPAPPGKAQAPAKAPAALAAPAYQVPGLSTKASAYFN